MREETEPSERTLGLTPTWSVATVLTIFVFVSLIVERSIHRLSNWLQKTKRKPLFAALEKMKEELMLLGFISLLLTATSSTIANICVSSSFHNDRFVPCTPSEINEELESTISTVKRTQLTRSLFLHTLRRRLSGIGEDTCSEGHEPFLSYEGMEQLHRFIFIMAVTHVTYSCLTMLLAIVKIHRWRIWEDEVHMDRNDCLTVVAREKIFRRQTTFVQYHTSAPLVKNRLLVWVICFFRQFGHSVVRSDYLTLRKGFIMLVLLVGAKLQHVIATLALENAGITEYASGIKLRPRDELFWFKKPKLLLSLIHFIQFQNAFELASFFWFWWQFGYNSCFLRNHLLVYLRLILGFSGQFLCSYSTLPLYALVTQMGTNYKAALLPQRVRETINGWGKATRRKRRHGLYGDDSTIRTETSTIASVDEYNDQVLDVSETSPVQDNELELQLIRGACGNSSSVETPILRPCASISSTTFSRLQTETTDSLSRSSSLPMRREC
ncbi:unnamed protein product [Arabidopsis thaliana]|uniref:MLO-like protein n=1 Tax=Arabidopsis thaliana TaxID=3702 RepID=A0A7G2DXG4_ARATH|nr:unnamed protein product [Arabidopsis thaliana]